MSYYDICVKPYDAPRPTVRPRTITDPEEAIREAERLLRVTGAKAKVVRLIPAWRPGDVIVIRHTGSSAPGYTYVRGATHWLTSTRPMTDETVNRLFNAGKVTPVLQSGGEPFDLARVA